LSNTRHEGRFFCAPGDRDPDPGLIQPGRELGESPRGPVARRAAASGMQNRKPVSGPYPELSPQVMNITHVALVDPEFRTGLLRNRITRGFQESQVVLGFVLVSRFAMLVDAPVQKERIPAVPRPDAHLDAGEQQNHGQPEPWKDKERDVVIPSPDFPDRRPNGFEATGIIHKDDIFYVSASLDNFPGVASNHHGDFGGRVVRPDRGGHRQRQEDIPDAVGSDDEDFAEMRPARVCYALRTLHVGVNIREGGVTCKKRARVRPTAMCRTSSHDSIRSEAKDLVVLILIEQRVVFEKLPLFFQPMVRGIARI